MRRYAYLFLPILLFTIAIIVLATTSMSYSIVDRDGLKEFLESQYVPEAGLLRAATVAYPDNTTIWIASDNLLAARALIVLGSPYGSIIEEVLYNNYSGGWDKLHEVLLGVNIPDVFREPTIIVLGNVYSRKFNVTLTIKYEYHNGSIINDWRDYADLVVYRALDKLIEGSKQEAIQLFENLIAMWDGYGFRDKASINEYTTYKLALAIYLYRALKATGLNVGQYEDIINKCYEILSRLQRSDGGIITNYIVANGEIIPRGDANVETTSIVALALYSNYPETIIRNTTIENIQTQPLNTTVIALILILTLIIITLSYVVLKRRS